MLRRRCRTRGRRSTGCPAASAGLADTRRVGDRHDVAVLLEHAALDVAQPPRGLGMVVGRPPSGFSPDGSVTPAVRIGRAASGARRRRVRRCIWILATSTAAGADAHAFAAAGDEPGEMDAQHVVARRRAAGSRSGRATSVVAMRGRDAPSAETIAPGERPAAVVADDALDAAEDQARLLEDGRERRRPSRAGVWADTDVTVNPTIAAAARSPVRRAIGFPP